MLNGLVDRPDWCSPYADLERFSARKHPCVFLRMRAAIRGWNVAWRAVERWRSSTQRHDHNMEYPACLRLLLEESGYDHRGQVGLRRGGGCVGRTGGRSEWTRRFDECWSQFQANGEALRQGNTVIRRALVVPGWEGNLWVKWLRGYEGHRRGRRKREGKPRNIPIRWPNGTSRKMDMGDGRESPSSTTRAKARNRQFRMARAFGESPGWHGPGRGAITRGGCLHGWRGLVADSATAQPGTPNGADPLLSGLLQWDGAEMPAAIPARWRHRLCPADKTQLRDGGG